jgi:UPF0755 protein
MGNKTKRKSWVRNFAILFLVALLIGVGAIVGARRYYNESLKPVSSAGDVIEVTIPTGYTLPQIADLLKEKQLIRSSQVFQQYVRNNGAAEDIKAGTYELSPSNSVQEIVAIITEGKIASNLVTIPPGTRVDQVERILRNSGYTAEEAKAALNPANYTDHPALADKPKNASLEGYLYPESFQRTSATSAQEIITLSLDEMQQRLTPERREAFAKQGLSVYKAITLASILEREVVTQSDRQQAAQVFLKRLNESIKLQSDATAKYGAVLAGVDDQLDYSQTLVFSSKYNTYQNAGLPPGPISNVSESSLDAVANPAQTDWLFFVSGDDGKTYFSRTAAEHEALTERYCKKLCGN